MSAWDLMSKHFVQKLHFLCTIIMLTLYKKGYHFELKFILFFMHNMKLKVVLNQVKKHGTSNLLNHEQYHIFFGIKMRMLNLNSLKISFLERSC